MFRRDNDRNFPQWPAVIPEYRAGDPGTITIQLNPEYLSVLLGAISDGKAHAGLALTFPAPKKGEQLHEHPIVVETMHEMRVGPGKYKSPIGVLMQVRPNTEDMAKRRKDGNSL